MCVCDNTYEVLAAEAPIQTFLILAFSQHRWDMGVGWQDKWILLWWQSLLDPMMPAAGMSMQVTLVIIKVIFRALYTKLWWNL